MTEKQAHVTICVALSHNAHYHIATSRLNVYILKIVNYKQKLKIIQNIASKCREVFTTTVVKSQCLIGTYGLEGEKTNDFGIKKKKNVLHSEILIVTTLALYM